MKLRLPSAEEQGEFMNLSRLLKKKQILDLSLLLKKKKKKKKKLATDLSLQPRKKSLTTDLSLQLKTMMTPCHVILESTLKN